MLSSSLLVSIHYIASCSSYSNDLYGVVIYNASLYCFWDSSAITDMNVTKTLEKTITTWTVRIGSFMSNSCLSDSDDESSLTSLPFSYHRTSATKVASTFQVCKTTYYSFLIVFC